MIVRIVMVDGREQETTRRCWLDAIRRFRTADVCVIVLQLVGWVLLALGDGGYS